MIINYGFLLETRIRKRLQVMLWIGTYGPSNSFKKKTKKNDRCGCLADSRRLLLGSQLPLEQIPQKLFTRGRHFKIAVMTYCFQHIFFIYCCMPCPSNSLKRKNRFVLIVIQYTEKIATKILMSRAYCLVQVITTMIGWATIFFKKNNNVQLIILLLKILLQSNNYISIYV